MPQMSPMFWIIIFIYIILIFIFMITNIYYTNIFLFKNKNKKFNKKYFFSFYLNQNFSKKW